MLERFDALPSVPMPNGTVADLNDSTVLPAVKAGWLRDGFNRWTGGTLNRRGPLPCKPGHLLFPESVPKGGGP